MACTLAVVICGSMLLPTGMLAVCMGWFCMMQEVALTAVHLLSCPLFVTAHLEL